MGIHISGVGSHLPSRTLTNQELTRTLDSSNEWIVSHTGIRERRLAAPEEAPSDLGYRAALRCLERSGIHKSEVDLLVVACATPDQSQPAVACMIQDKLGIAGRQCPAFDVNSVCAGFVFALDVAQSMMLTHGSRFRNALVIGTDAFSKILDWQDRRTCIFFGDGAGAVLLTRTPDDERRIHFALGSDGRGRRCIEVAAGGTRRPVDADVLQKRANTFSMRGPAVWDFAVDTVPRVINSLLAEHGLRPRDLDLVVLHQSNLRMIEAIMASLDLPMDRTVTTIETCGNTAAASIPVTLEKAFEQGRLKPGSRVMLCGFGGGLSWGAALLDCW
jgi:3-oxoacyl-[acyl-carrier-protein] synthase III